MGRHHTHRDRGHQNGDDGVAEGEWRRPGDRLVATQEEFADGETLVAYDDIWVVSPVPELVNHACGSLQRGFESMVARHRFGTDLRDVMHWITQAAYPTARDWRGSGETDAHLSRVSCPVCHPSTSGEEGAEQRTLLERIPIVTDLQSVWLILALRLCKSELSWWSPSLCWRMPGHMTKVFGLHVRPPEHQRHAGRR